ncbi:MAG: radical SAM protein [Anaerolineae bacterium]|nr:radical SAM protein [Anaerolineae bacterium]
MNYPIDDLPGYLVLARSGELERRARAAWQSLSCCELCPHCCGVDRLSGEEGRCRSGALPRVASWTLHPWEEPPISGTRGSGTIFFSGCTGRCRFCQNYPISQMGVGQTVSIERLAEMMLDLQRRGAHNINFVTPTHWTAAILMALPLAVQGGLRLPLLYNCSGYERIETLHLLDGVIDIWLPDAKYGDDEVARSVSGFTDYVRHNRRALCEMYRQVGAELILDENGLARHGIIVRHLVLPGELAGTALVMRWLAENLPGVHVSLMDQYFPAFECVDDPLLGRKITADEYDTAFQALVGAGLDNGWVQEHEDVCALEEGVDG